MSGWQDARCDSGSNRTHYRRLPPRHFDRRRYNTAPLPARRSPTDISIVTKDRAFRQLQDAFSSVDNTRDWSYFHQGMIDCLLRYNAHMHEQFQTPYLFDGLTRLICAYVKYTGQTTATPHDTLLAALKWSLYTSQTTLSEPPSRSHEEVAPPPDSDAPAGDASC